MPANEAAVIAGPGGPGLAAARVQAGDGADDYRRLFQANPTPVLVVGHESLRLVAANQAATRALGFSEAELLAGSLPDFASPGDRAALRVLPDPAPVPGLLVARSSWTLSRRDGSPIRMEVSGARVTFAGHPAALLFQPPEREPSAQDVARTGASDPEFSFSALHDLKEPLHLVKGYLSLLRKRGLPALDPESREYLEYAYAGTQRMQALVLNLLEFFRVDAKGVAPEPVDLGSVLQETLEGLRLQVQEAEAHVESDPLPTVLADRVQASRVLQNLLSNSLKFRAGPGPRIQVRARQAEAHWDISVKDDGIGIDPKDQARVLEPFQRVHSTDRYPGTGLGLSICRKIVELHGGRLWIESALGKGTEVHFTLPRKEA